MQGVKFEKDQDGLLEKEGGKKNNNEPRHKKKPVFGVYHQVRPKPACSATETR